jgi:integrase
MGRRRDTGGVRKRGSTWWIFYRVDGKQYDESARTGDERAARSLLASRRREIREGTWRPPTSRAIETEVDRLRERLEELAPMVAPVEPQLTIAAYTETWIARRESAGVRNVHDEATWLRTWLVPRFGDRGLADVTRSDVRDLVLEVQATKSAITKREYSARTVLHVYNTIRLLFVDAVTDGLVASSPCTLRQRRGELPAKKDRDPRWRANAVYSRDEAELLISDERIPHDRRVYYALQLLAGMRAGEAAARRWRDIDDAEPLARILVWSQSDGGAERDTKTGDVREAPMHPELARVLEGWKRGGFALRFGRHPRADDLIVPSRRGVEVPRTKKMLVRLKEDLARLGMRTEGRGRHAMRATFLTLLEADGANMAIARRVTHAAPSDVVAGYVRTSWADVCREVAKLRIDTRRAAVVKISKRRAAASANTDNLTDSQVVETTEPLDFQGFSIGATGFEAHRRAGSLSMLGNERRERGASDPKNAGRANAAPQTLTHSLTPALRGALARAIEDARSAGRLDDARELELLVDELADR